MALRRRSKVLLVVTIFFWVLELLPLTSFGLHLLSHLPISSPVDSGKAEEKGIALAVLWMFLGIAGIGLTAVTCFFCAMDWLHHKKSAATIHRSEASS